jgi:hypothetical protein
MNIVPTNIQERVNKVDRTPSLVIGIVLGLVALGCIFSLLSTIYAAAVYSSIGVSAMSWIFPIVMYGVIGALAAIGAIAFLTRYSKQP